MPPQPSSADTYTLPKALRDRIEGVLDKYAIPGLSISVVRKHDGKWEEGVTTMGIRDGTGAPWEPDSIFAIASASKVFTAASIGLLIDRGTVLPNGEKLAWTTKIKDVLPTWRMVDRNTEENADIEDALSMRLGLPANVLAFGAPDDTAKNCVERMGRQTPVAPLRKAAIYTNDGFSLVGEIIAELTGKPYHVFATENILDPLGMTESSFERNEALKTGRRVEGFLHYGRDVKKTKAALGKGEWAKEAYGEMSRTRYWNEGDGLYFAAAGGISTTGIDMLRWLRETLDPKVLSKATLDELNRPRQAFGGVTPPHPTLSMSYYGIGQVTSYYRGHRMVSHGGGIPGHYSQVLRLPDDDIAIAAFCNDDNYGAQMVGVASMMVVDELLGVEPINWEEVYLYKGLKEETTPEKPPTSPRPSPDIAGTYHHPGYGTLTVTALEDHSMGAIYADLLKEYPGNTIPLQPSRKIYLGDLQQGWPGRLVLAAHDGPVFRRDCLRAEEIQLLGEKEGSRYAGLVWFRGKCVATADGIGMFEDFWGQGGSESRLEVSKCVEENVEEKAEVWFRKIR